MEDYKPKKSRNGDQKDSRGKKSMKLIISFEEMNKTGKLLTRQAKKREDSNK